MKKKRKLNKKAIIIVSIILIILLIEIINPIKLYNKHQLRELNYSDSSIDTILENNLKDEVSEIEYNKTFLRNINLDFSLRELADYLAVNRSAMFRELKRLKEDKFIKINGRRITLLYK